MFREMVETSCESHRVLREAESLPSLTGEDFLWFVCLSVCLVVALSIFILYLWMQDNPSAVTALGFLGPALGSDHDALQVPHRSLSL